MAQVVAHTDSYLSDIRVAADSLSCFAGQLKGSNVLVTGATGMIGMCVVRMLLSIPGTDCNVYALGRNESRAARLFSVFSCNPRFHFIVGDITGSLNLDCNFEYIIHAASDASPAAFVKTPVEVMKANLTGLVNLLEYGGANGMRRFLYVSSGEVYGQGDGRPFDESYSGYVDCRSPRSCYPSSKRAAESFCAAYLAEYGLETVIARPCHVFGPEFTEKDNRAFAQFIRNGVSGCDIVMKSDGRQFRSWCYVVDCASALIRILIAGAPGEAYNVADRNANASVREFAETVAEITQSKVLYEVPSENEKIGYNKVTESVFCTDKLESLGWCAVTHLKEGLKHSIEWLISE